MQPWSEIALYFNALLRRDEMRLSQLRSQLRPESRGPFLEERHCDSRRIYNTANFPRCGRLPQACTATAGAAKGCCRTRES